MAIARSLVNNPRVLLADEPTGNLDSRTSEEILEMFQQFNSVDGITIILVTHYLGVAKHARRAIHIKDGLINGTETGRRYVMRLYSTLNIAFSALGRNVMRTLLTTLGIVIGVGAVITMMEIGNGTTIAIQRTMASIGADTLVVVPGASVLAVSTRESGSRMTLTPQDADAIVKECPAVRNVQPIVRARTQVVYGNRNWVPTYIYGTTPSFLDVRNGPI